MSQTHVTLASGKKLGVVFDRTAFREILCRLAPEVLREADIRVNIIQDSLPGIDQIISVFNVYNRAFRPENPKGVAHGLTVPWVLGGPRKYCIFLLVDRIASSADTAAKFQVLCGRALSHEVGHVLDYATLPLFFRMAMALYFPALVVIQAEELLHERSINKGFRKAFSAIPYVYTLALMGSGLFRMPFAEARARSYQKEQMLSRNTAKIWKSAFIIKELNE